MGDNSGKEREETRYPGGRGGNSTRCGGWVHLGNDGDEQVRNSPRLQAERACQESQEETRVCRA